MLEDIIKREKNENEVNSMSPLIWAYVGDCVYELHIRMMLVNNTKLKPHMLHVNSIKYVKAEAQAKILKNIEKNLTEQESKEHVGIFQGQEDGSKRRRAPTCSPLCNISPNIVVYSI